VERPVTTHVLQRALTKKGSRDLLPPSRCSSLPDWNLRGIAHKHCAGNTDVKQQTRADSILSSSLHSTCSTFLDLYSRLVFRDPPQYSPAFPPATYHAPRRDVGRVNP